MKLQTLIIVKKTSFTLIVNDVFFRTFLVVILVPTLFEFNRGHYHQRHQVVLLKLRWKYEVPLIDRLEK